MFDNIAYHYKMNHSSVKLYIVMINNITNHSSVILYIVMINNIANHSSVKLYIVMINNIANHSSEISGSLCCRSLLYKV
jgi:hypothetical protein